MSIENPSFEENSELESESQGKKENIYIKNRDLSKEHATELQKEVAEIQAAKLEATLYKLMSRTENNPDLVNSLNKFLDSLDHQSRFGDSGKPLGKGRQQDLVAFLEDAADALRWDVGGGNKPAGRKPKWESKQ